MEVVGETQGILTLSSGPPIDQPLGVNRLNNQDTIHQRMAAAARSEKTTEIIVSRKAQGRFSN